MSNKRAPTRVGAKDRVGLMVLGMHRSGTSAITRVLNLLGVELGERLMPPQEGVNDQGFWEHVDVVDLHDRLLHWHQRDWHDVRGLPADIAKDGTGREAVRAARQIIRRDFADSPYWVIKDPRLCLTVAIWREAIREEGMRARFVLTIRHPEEVAASLAKRDSLSRGHAFLLWGQYIVAAVRGSDSGSRIVVDYANLLGNWRGEVARISTALDIDWPVPMAACEHEIDAFLDASLRRHRSSELASTSNDALASAVFRLYDLLGALARDQGDWLELDAAITHFESISEQLVPHLNELLQHIYMHDARARDAEDLVTAGLNGKATVLLAMRDALMGPDSLSDRVEALSEDTRAFVEQARAELSKTPAALSQVIQEKEQRLRDAAQQAGQREAWLAELRTHASALEARRSQLEQQTVALDGAIHALQVELEGRDLRIADLSHVIAEKEQRLRDAAHQSGQREAWLAELRTHASALEARRSQLEQQTVALDGAIHALQVEREGRDLRIADLSSAMVDKDKRLHESEQHVRQIEYRLRDAQILVDIKTTELAQTLASRSWRITAPMRWLRSVAAGVRHGRPIANYRQMLAVAGARNTADAVPQACVASAIPSANLKREQASANGAEAGPDPSSARELYLDVLFADEKDKRAPEFRAASDAPAPAPETLRAKVIAFYLPQFHPIAENDAWWGPGFTEWANVTRAVPQFLGHYQPRLPGDLGFYDLRLSEVIRQQAQLAYQYGIHGFCFHYYWFAGRRLLEQPLELFIADKDIDFPFCLCWANENWTRRWDGHDQEILMAQEHSPESDLAFIRDLVPYLRDRRYIRVDGKPLVIVYRPSILPDCAATLLRWRDHCRDVGIGEIFLSMVQFDVEDPRVYGFDAAMEFPPHKLASGFDAINAALDIVNPGYQGHVVHYQSIVDSAKLWPKPDYPLVRGVFPGWDNEARRPGKGYTFAFATPERYREWLDNAVGFAEQNPVGGEKLVMINAWNEWAEGAYLEPDRRFGHAYLQTTREVLEAPGLSANAARPRIVVVSHDAHPHGAQYLALHLVRELDQAFGYHVDVVLLGDGGLTTEFARHATLHEAGCMAGDPAALDGLAARLYSSGARAAIVNTTVSGLFAAALKRAGLRVVSLVHELPRLIADYGLESHAISIAEHAEHVVFAAPQVRDGFAKVATVPPERTVVRAQGLFSRSRYLGRTDLAEPRTALRRKLGIPLDHQVVLAVGYGDYRKGLDIFGEATAILAARHRHLHFVWVGHYDEQLMIRVRDRLKAVGALDRLHTGGLDFDTDDYYAGADIYALTSREDPFPSVLLESLSVGLPVVAFSGAGGAEQLIARGCGRLVETPSAQAFAEVLHAFLLDPAGRADCAAIGRNVVAQEFSFRRYVFDLLELAGNAPPRISVVVPNYNYASLLRDRLSSISKQDLPPYEVIVLDDDSSDDSLSVLAALRAEIPMDFSVVPAAANSGSVFRQWLKGVELARGEYVWIAEADDLADPQFLSTVVAALNADPGVAMSYCQSRAIDGDGKSLFNDYLAYTNDLSTERWRHPYIASGEQEVNAGLAVKNTIPNVSAVVFRRDALLETLRDGMSAIGTFGVAGDWVTYLMLLKRGRIAYTPAALNLHRRHRNSVTTNTLQLPHLQEVLQVQQFARQCYPVSSDCAAIACHYAQTLYEQFDLADKNAPRVEMHRELMDFFADTYTYQHPGTPAAGSVAQR